MKSLRILERLTSTMAFAAIFICKMMYYNGRIRSGWFPNGWCIPWISISLVISLAPMICIFISSMMLKKTFSSALLIVGGCLLALPLVMLGDPLAGLMVKFQGADDALAVILVDRLCRCRIYRL